MNKSIENILACNKSVISLSKDVVSSCGCLVRKVASPELEDSIQHAPFALLPSPFSKSCFEEALEIQQELQLLIHKVAYDYKFLWECLESVIQVDEYTRNIWKIYDTVRKEEIVQPICLAMIRSDYMLHVTASDDETADIGKYTCIPSSVVLKQVEINTISSSFGGLAQQLYSYHRFIAGKVFGAEHALKIPVNTSCECLAEGLVTAWRSYENNEAVLLFLVYDVERNIYDQRHLEVSVSRLDPRVKVIRRSLTQLQNEAKLDGERRLFVGELEVALVYQRSLYNPLDFVDENSWKCRLMIERSRAILCPNAGYHLAGTKKVQQVLSMPGVLERFVTEKDVRDRLRKTFMKIYGLEMNEEGDRAIEEGINNFSQYVLKPQREGGGNNIYGSDVSEMLKKVRSSEERLSYILMERINPMVVRNVPIIANSSDTPEPFDMLSELGVFGVLVGSEKNVLLNKQGGYLLRTKKVGTNEGGVATGYSVLDSPYLVD